MNDTAYLTCTQVYMTWIMKENLINLSWILLLLLEHIKRSIGYRSNFTKHLLYQKKEVELLIVQLFYLIERSRIIFSFCLGLFFPMPTLAWCLASFWHTDVSCLNWGVLKYHWCFWDHLLAHGEKKPGGKEVLDSLLSKWKVRSWCRNELI